MSRNLLQVFFSMAIVNNFVTALFLGLCSFFGLSKRLKEALLFSIAVGLVLFLSAIVAWFITYKILIPYNILYMNNVVYILVIATLVQLVEMFIKRTNATLYNAFGIYLPLITVHCAVLGITFINLRENYTLIESTVAAIGGAVGFALVMTIMSCIREKLELADIPVNFRGLPTAIFLAMLLGLTFVGFGGIL